MFDIILAALAFVFVFFLVMAAMQPGDFRITRSALLAVKPEAIFPEVNDLRKWEAWSPWVRLDPNANMRFEGPPSGVGAIAHWDGNAKVGKGSMTIVESNAPGLIRLRLDFLKPMKATSVAEFNFDPEGGQTIVTWSMSGKNNFIGKAMGLIFNCEKMVGGQFEKGLANLKERVESGSMPPSSAS